VLLHGPLEPARQGRHAATELRASATVTFVPGTGITRSALTVTGVVTGIDAAGFTAAAEAAKDGCRCRAR